MKESWQQKTRLIYHPLIVFLISCRALADCSVNILEEFSDKDTDEAIFFTAKQKINDSDYAGAISEFEKLSSTFLARRDVQIIYASAYAGRCGLNLVDLVGSLADLGSTLLLRFLMGEYSGASATNISDCQTAIQLIEDNISDDASDRTTDENVFLAFLSFATMGVILSTDADTNDDGNADGGFNGCSSASISDSNAQWVGYSIVLVSNSLGALSTSVGGDQLTAIQSFCTALAGLGATYNFCTATSPSGITGDALKGVRSLIQENQYMGIGSCNNTLVNCVCP